MGKDGVLVLTADGGPRQVAAPAADRVVDTTGCGDVFAAATLRLLARGVPLIEAASAGVVLASNAVGLAGIEETYRLAQSSREGSGLNI
jgi:sugar/nucleoside kinase (ribokinase family)